jgi:hypothetical protein
MENKNSIKIVLQKKFAYSKNDKGKVEPVINPDKSHAFRILDMQGLQNILQTLDTRTRNTPNDWKQSIKINDKLVKLFLEKDDQNETADEIELTIDEASFLKRFLTEFPDKEGKNLNRTNKFGGKLEGLQEFEQRALINILEQL